jgi:hypothetical protein
MDFTVQAQGQTMRSKSKPIRLQDEVEFFSHLRIEAGPGPYNWLNGLVCLGVMSCQDGKIWIDAYHLTNFPGVKPEDVIAKA